MATKAKFPKKKPKAPRLADILQIKADLEVIRDNIESLIDELDDRFPTKKAPSTGGVLD